jgi:hypothetical protein
MSFEPSVLRENVGPFIWSTLNLPPVRDRYRSTYRDKLIRRVTTKWRFTGSQYLRTYRDVRLARSQVSMRSGYWDNDKMVDRRDILDAYDSYVMATDRIEKLWRRHFGSLGNMYDWWLESHLRAPWKRFIDAFLSDRRRIPKPDLMAAYRDIPVAPEDFEDIRREWEESFHIPTPPAIDFLPSSSSEPDYHDDPDYRSYVDGLMVSPSSPPRSDRGSSLGTPLMGYTVGYSDRATGRSGRRDFRHGRRNGRATVMTKKKAARVRRGGTYYGLRYDADGFVSGIDVEHYRKLYRREFGDNVVVFEDWAQPGRFGTFSTVGAQRKWVFAKDASGRLFRFRRFPHGWVGAPWNGRVPSSYYRDGGLLFKKNLPSVEATRFARYNK